MAPISRRNTRIKDDEKLEIEDKGNSYSFRLTRRQSSINNVSTTPTKTSKSTLHNKKKLSSVDICKDLESSDDEIKILESNQKNISVAAKKITRSSSMRLNSTETPKRLTKSRRTVFESYNEDYLITKNQNSLREPDFKLENTPKKSKYQLLNNKDEKINTPSNRKRSVKTTQTKSEYRQQSDENKNEDCEVDENKMHNANAYLSPKRLRSEINAKQTPIKNLKTSSKNTVKISKETSKSVSHCNTPSKNSKIHSKTFIDSPIKALSRLKLDESSISKVNRRTRYSCNSDSPEISSKTLYRSSNNQSKNKSKLTVTKRKCTKSKLSDDDYEIDESESSQNNENEYDESDSSEAEKDKNLSEDSNDDEIIYSPRGKKVARQILATPKKTPKSNCRTPKNLNIYSKVSMESPTKGLSRLSLKNSLTPSVHQRIANIIKPSTPLQEARLKLHVSILPKSLPCREEQFNDIYTFLHARLSDSSGGCIYISGVPGTGKTATVNEVIRCLKKLMNAGKLPKFEFIDINGMKLSEPRQSYVQIWKQLTGQSTTWEEAHRSLQGRFNKSDSKRNMTLLLVDELDLLCTKRQDVVYNLLDWPSKVGAKLIVVTIANTMDLPERILMGKVTSRLGLTRLTFPPYNFKQLEEIVVSRLKGYNAFSGETVQLVARKVAAVSGDARRALDICRRATEIAEISNHEKVSIIDVKKALDEMIASPKIQAIKHCSDTEKIFLQAVCAEVTRTGVEEVVFKNVYFQLDTLCTFNGVSVPNVTEALSICARLGSWRLILCDHSKIDIHQRLLLNVSTDDVHFATQDIVA